MPPKPRATYRLQLRPGFGLKEATEILDYLADLGISHVYTSPYLQAAHNSTHGYDVVDPSQINTQLGNDLLHQEFCETVQKLNLGSMIDIVPNHMAIIGKQNPWWWDVLENGPSSPFAIYFDVDWDSSEERWPNKVLLPVLGNHYGRILENQELRLDFNDGHFILFYHDQSFPIDPSSLSSLLKRAADSIQSELLAFLAESYARLPRPTVTSRQSVERRHRDTAVLTDLLLRLTKEEPATKSAIEAEIEELNRNPNRLDALIDQQNYRLAFWNTASRDLGYRRFFDIKDLVGMRIEDFEVFQATHALPMQWYKKGWVQGLRVDHPDGLRNPSQYFRRLQDACPDAWVIAEKILMPGEKLPENWKIDGTTGYDFLNLANELFIDPKGKELPVNADFKTLVYQCKLLVLEDLFGSELNRLTTLFVEICEKHRRHRDYSSQDLKEALCLTAACFPVYRSYVLATVAQVTPSDEKVIGEAIEKAMSAKPHLDRELFLFLKEILLLRIDGEMEGELAMRFQQLTGPAMAKGVEDTAFYRYTQLISLNEVGGDPGTVGISLEQFHQACQEAKSLSLLATTTHDTKRSEDVRARLALLSEIPQQWIEVRQRWFKMNEKYRCPDRNTETFFYQTLVGAWPLTVERATQYMEKAIREAKENTSWTKPNKEYENQVRNFVIEVLKDRSFISDLEQFIVPLIYPGHVNGLAQTLIKLTVPGIPDIFQGSELWNLTLVDPDNRNAVDYHHRRKLLSDLKTLSPQEIVSKMDEGLPKLWVIYQTLQLRKSRPDLFQLEYQPIYAQGTKKDHAVAFMRGNSLLTLVPRLTLGVGNRWEETSLELPPGSWHHLFTKEVFKGSRAVEELLANYPVALLVKE